MRHRRIPRITQRRTECVKNFLSEVGGYRKSWKLWKIYYLERRKGPTSQGSDLWIIDRDWNDFIFLYQHISEHTSTHKCHYPLLMNDIYYTHVQNGSTTTRIRMLSASPFYRRKHFINFDSPFRSPNIFQWRTFTRYTNKITLQICAHNFCNPFRPYQDSYLHLTEWIFFVVTLFVSLPCTLLDFYKTEH